MNPSFALTQFTVDEFTAFWPKLEEMLDLVPHTWRHWTKEYICSSAASNVIQVWGIGPPPNAVLVFFTQVSIYPVGRVLTLVWGAGSFDEEMLPLLLATMVNFAKMNNCTEIEMRGRRGWGPSLRSIGMKEEYVVWSIPVPDMRMN